MRLGTHKSDLKFPGKIGRFFTAVFLLLFIQLAEVRGQAVSCPPNIDFSWGSFGNWWCWTGTSAVGTTSVLWTAPVFSGPVPGRHEVTSGTGIDPYGFFTVVAPGGGLFSSKIGNNSVNFEAERIQYYVRVPAGINNYSFVYKYAVVLENGGHTDDTQPAFMISYYDSATGLPVNDCGSIAYVAGTGRPGFTPSTVDPNVAYMPWNNGTLNLSGMGGRTVVVEVTSYDCAGGAHFGYGYFDVVSCGQFAAAITWCNLAAGYVTLSAPFGYKSYKWFKGPTISGAPINTSQSWNAPIPPSCGYYICVLEPYLKGGCPDTIRTKTICDFKLNATPDTVCNSLGKPIQLGVTLTGGLGGVYTYKWLPNPALSCTSCTNPIATPMGSDIYVVTATDSVGCFRQDTVTVQNPTFKLNLGPDLTTCLGTPVALRPSLTPAGAGYTFTWTPGTYLNNSTVLNPTFTPHAVGWDTLILRVDSSLCATVDTMRIRTLPNTFDAIDTAVCEDIAFTARIEGDDAFTFVWTPNVNTVLDFTGTANGRKPTINPDTTRTFIVTAKYPTCPDIVRNITFRVEPMPKVDLGFDTVQKCFYNPLYLTAHVQPSWFTRYTHQWQTNDDIDDLGSPIITFTGKKDTNLYVTVKTPLGCTGTDSVFVQVYQGKFAAVTPDDTAVCPHNPVHMSAKGGVSYLWRPSLYLSDSTSANVTANPQTSTDYTLYVTDKNGCVDTLPISLQVFSEARLSLPDSALLYPGQSFQMDPLGNALYFSWFPTVGLSNPHIANPLATPQVNTRYFVTGTTESGCVATDSIYVMVNEESVLNIPNAFTPGVAPNSEFNLLHLGIANLKYLRIYNRWGTKVFESTDINKGWDGQFNGKPQPMDVYVYTVEATTNKGNTFKKQGNVTLIR